MTGKMYVIFVNGYAMRWPGFSHFVFGEGVGWERRGERKADVSRGILNPRRNHLKK